MMPGSLVLCPDPGLLFRIPLGQAPSLHTLRRTGPPPLFVRVLLRYYGLVRLPIVVHRGCTLVSGRTDRVNKTRPTTGPPEFRAGCFDTCMGSTTTRSPHTPCDTSAYGVAFRFGERRRHSGRKNFRGSIPSPYPPLSTLAITPRGETAMTRGPVRLATPSLQETFTLSILPTYLGASPRFSRGSPYFFDFPSRLVTGLLGKAFMMASYCLRVMGSMEPWRAWGGVVLRWAWRPNQDPSRWRAVKQS